MEQLVRDVREALRGHNRTLGDIQHRIARLTGSPASESAVRTLGRFVACRFLAKGVESPQEVFERVFAKPRAAVPPASTNDPAWAGQLSGKVIAAALIDQPAPPTIFARLAAYGVGVQLGEQATAQIPSFASHEPVGDWIFEGAPIPVVMVPTTNLEVGPRKLAAITQFSNELRRRSPWDIETILGTLVRNDLALLVDGALTDAVPANATRPGGLRAGQTPIAGSGDPIADMKSLAAAMAGFNRPVVLMSLSAEAVLGLSLAVPFSWPVLASAEMPPQTLIGVDAAAFVSTQRSVEVEVSADVAVHEASPADAIAIGGAMSNPVRSLWQTDTSSARTIWSVGWACPADSVVVMEGATWA